MSDVGAIRWESVATVAGVFALAIWALRDPEAARATPAVAGEQGAVVLRFKVASRNNPARSVELADGAILGRATDCDLALDDSTVSKHHARVHFDGKPSIEDLGSTNGTYANGRRVESTSALRRGDRIALGAAKIVFLGLGRRGPKHPKG